MADDFKFKPDPASSLTFEWVVRQFWRIAELVGWNAFGNTATGNIDGSDRLKIENASFWIDNGAGNGGNKTATGDYPSGAENQGGFETKLLWYGKAGAFRAGLVSTDRWDEAKIGAQSFAVGVNSEASGSSSIAIGDSNLATQNYASAIGNGNTCSGLFTAAYGYNCTVSSAFVGVAIGNQCNVSGNGAFVIGSGAGAGTARFANSQANSVAIGANINSGAGDKATLFLKDKKCGVENESPLSTMDIGGSVGYGYNIISSGSNHTVGASDNELVFLITSTSGAPFVFTLPAISGIDRRMYHVRNARTSGNVDVTPNASDAIDYDPGVAAPATSQVLTLLPGDSAQIVADATSSTNTWWVI